MKDEPFTIGELIDILSEFDREKELRFIGANGEIFFHRFKQRGENLETMELDDPETYEKTDSLLKEIRG